MIIRRTVPPSASPLCAVDLLNGLMGMFRSSQAIQKLKEELKEFFGVKHVFLVSSGKAALTIILRALRSLSVRDEVLFPAYTCFSVPSAVLKAGLNVSLCDIDLSTLDFDYKVLKDEINENTLCIIPSHLFGIPSDLDRIKSLCQSRGIFVVEDGAQAMGGTYGGKKIGTVGDVGFFSLGRGKNITSGSGGIIVTNSDEIAGEIRKVFEPLESPNTINVLKEFFSLFLMTIFIRPSLFWFPSGLRFLKLGQTIFYKEFKVEKLSGLKAGFLRNWRQRLEKSNKARMANSEYFSKHLNVKPLGKGSIFYLRWPLLTQSADEKSRIYDLSQKQGLGISLVYPTSINEVERFKLTFKGRSFPSAKKFAESLLVLPTHHLVSAQDLKRISALFEPGVADVSRKEPLKV